MLLQSLFPSIPSDPIQIMLGVVALLGVVLLTYSVFLEQENRRDLVLFIGAACLFVYALVHKNTIFMLAMAGLCIASLIEFTEIYLGLHKHSPEDLKRYKKMWRISKKQ